MKKRLVSGAILFVSVFAAPLPGLGEDTLLSSYGITSWHNPDGSTMDSNGNGGVGRSQNLFNGTFGDYQTLPRCPDNGYVVIDLMQNADASAGGYYVRNVKVDSTGTKAYSIYVTTDGGNWTAVDGAVQTKTIGVAVHEVGAVATQVKYVFNDGSRNDFSTAYIAEIQVWGCDPSETACTHPAFTDWSEVSNSVSCTEFGRLERFCTVCGDRFEMQDSGHPPHGHDYAKIAETNATPAAVGSGRLECKRCGDRIEFPGAIDLATLGGLAVDGLVQFTDLTVTSSDHPEWGPSPDRIIDGIWGTANSSLSWSSVGNNDQHVDFSFAFPVFIMSVEISVPNDNQTLRFFRVDDETGAETLLAVKSVLKDETLSGAETEYSVGTTGTDPDTGAPVLVTNSWQRLTVPIRDENLCSHLRLRIPDSQYSLWSGRSMCVHEMRPYGTPFGPRSVSDLAIQIDESDLVFGEGTARTISVSLSDSAPEGGVTLAVTADSADAAEHVQFPSSLFFPQSSRRGVLTLRGLDGDYTFSLTLSDPTDNYDAAVVQGAVTNCPPIILASTDPQNPTRLGMRVLSRRNASFSWRDIGAADASSADWNNLSYRWSFSGITTTDKDRVFTNVWTHASPEGEPYVIWVEVSDGEATTRGYFAVTVEDAPPGIALGFVSWRAGLLQSQWQGDGAPDWETPLPVGTPERTPGASMADIYVNYSTISSTGFQNPWTDRTTYFTNPHNMFGYSGQMWMKGGTTYVLAKNFLTLSMISVDGVPRVPASSSSVGVAAMTPTEDGWHDLDIRLYNQYAQAGPSSYNWNGAHGLGWNTNGVPSTTASLSKEGWNWFTLDGTDDEPMTLFRCQTEESFASIVSVALGENAILVDVEAGPDADVSATVFCDANFGEVGSPESWGIVSDIVPIPAGETRTVSVPWTGESTEPIISLRATGTHAGAFEQWSDILPVSERPVASALVTDVAYTNATVAVSIPYLGLGASSAQWEVRVCTDPDFSEDILRFPSQETITDGETASVPVNGLATNTVYYLCVAVENDLEEVSFSPSVSFRTLNPGHAEGNAQLRSRGFTTIHAFATVADFGDGSEWAKARLEASEDPAFAELSSVSDEEDVLSDSGQLLAVSGLSGGTEYHLRVRFVNEWGLVSFVDLGSVWTRDIPISAFGIGHQFPTDGLTMDVSFAVIEVFDDAICTATLFLDGREVGPQAFTEAGTFVWSGIPSSEQSAEARIVVSASVGNDTFEATWMSTIEPGTTTVAVSAVENHLSAGTAVRLRRGDSIQLPELVGSSAYEVLNPRFAALDGNVLTALEPGIVGVRCIDAASETNTLAVLVLPDAIADGSVYVFKEPTGTQNYAAWETPSLWEKIGGETNDSWPHEPNDIAILPFYDKATFRARLSSDISLGALYIGSFKDSAPANNNYFYIERSGSFIPTITFSRGDGGTALLQSCPNTASNRVVSPAFQNVRIKYDSDTVIDGGWSGIADNRNRGIDKSLFGGSVTNVVQDGITLTLDNIDGTGADESATVFFYGIEGGGTIWNRSHGSIRYDAFSPGFIGTIRDSSHLAGMTQRQGPSFIRNRFPNAVSESVGYVPTSSGRPVVNSTGVGVVATGWGSSGFNGAYYGTENWFTARGTCLRGGIWSAWHTGDLASGWTVGETDRKFGETFAIHSGFSMLSKTTGGKPINWIEFNSLEHSDKGSLLIVDPSRATVASTATSTNSVTILRGWQDHSVGVAGDCESTPKHPIVPWIVSPTSSTGVSSPYNYAFASFDSTNRLVRPVLRESAVSAANEGDNVLSASKNLSLTEDISVNSLILYNTRAAQRTLGAGRKLAIESGGLFLGGSGTSVGLSGNAANGSLMLGDENHPAYVWAASTSEASPNQIWADVTAPGGFVSAYTGWLVLGGNQTNIAKEIVVNAGTLALGHIDSPCLISTNIPVRIFANATVVLPLGETLAGNEIRFDGSAGNFGHVEIPAGVAASCQQALVRDYPERPEWTALEDGLYSGDEATASALGCRYEPKLFSGSGTMRIGPETQTSTVRAIQIDESDLVFGEGTARTISVSLSDSAPEGGVTLAVTADSADAAEHVQFPSSLFIPKNSRSGSLTLHGLDGDYSFSLTLSDPIGNHDDAFVWGIVTNVPPSITVSTDPQNPTPWGRRVGTNWKVPFHWNDIGASDVIADMDKLSCRWSFSWDATTDKDRVFTNSWMRASPEDSPYLVYVEVSDGDAVVRGYFAVTVEDLAPISVPHEWLDNYPVFLAEQPGDYELAALATAANGVNKIWECYVAGINPTNEAAWFEARVAFDADGKPVVKWTPDLNEGGTKNERIYTVEGKENLSDEWGPTNANSRFFRVKVSLPE